MDLNELESIKQKYLAEVNMRKNADTSGVDYKYDIMVCFELFYFCNYDSQYRHKP